MTRTATTTTERVCGFSPGMSGPSGTMISTQKTPATAGTVPGAADYLGVDMSDRMCEVGGCSRVHYARGLCNSHYIRLRKYGDVQADKPLPLVPESRRRSPREEIATRFWSKVDRNGPLGCWIWTAQTNRFGVGASRGLGTHARQDPGRPLHRSPLPDALVREPGSSGASYQPGQHPPRCVASGYLRP
jgi:hypothetical protein